MHVKAIGITTESISNNSSGFVTLNGKVRDLVLDDGTYTEGEVVYLSSTLAGGITNVQPDISVELGHVLAVSNGGNKAECLRFRLIMNQRCMSLSKPCRTILIPLLSATMATTSKTSMTKRQHCSQMVMCSLH